MPEDSTLDSPFASRYGSPEMRAIWSDAHKRALWRRLWVALAEAQSRAGVVSAAQVADLRSHAGQPNTARALELEREIGHDVMAEVRAFAEQCAIGGGIVHWGATSADITDNADVLRQRDALQLLRQRLTELLEAFAGQIEAHAALAGMAYTHIQPAEPTTLGYRLALYAQDLLEHWHALHRLGAALRGKGLKGAVGTAASYQEVLAGTAVTPAELEAGFLRALALPAFEIATQTYPRGQDYLLLATLAGLAASLHKFAFDLRMLQSQGMGELAEPFGEKQVGSSAMPFKRNPVNAEKICSLARYVSALPAVAWDNAAQALLERTLDDSANRRAALPEAFLALDECLRTARRLVRGLVVDPAAMAANLDKYGPFAATERVLMALVRAGADRQRAHERLREQSLKAWAAVKAGRSNPLADLLAADPELLIYLQPVRLQELMDARSYVGTAPERARALAARIRRDLAQAEAAPA
ncbi:MAG: adenylosuccinate lyase [Anaerolineales bacterium]|nr:adenylosuccinate lyase [Anaerolineales bacterium]